MTVNTMSPVAAPVALARPHSITHHGITVSDDYAWLRDPGYPDVKDADVLDYLARENAWFEAAMAPHKGLTDALFAEMKGRIKEDDSSVPQKDGDYIYWRAFETGAQYRKWYRRPVAAKDDGSADQLILDEPALAQGHDYFRLGAMSVSPDGRYLAYAIDNDGSERFEARIKDLFTGEILPESIPDTLSSLVWTSDSKGLLYGLANENWRTDNARLHWLGQSVESDVELFHEADEGFRVSIGLTSSEKWIVIATGDHVTTEAWLIPADNPTAPPLLVSARQAGREYDVDEHEGTLYIRTNDTHPNFRLVTATLAAPGQWTEVIAPDAHFYLTDFTLFKRFYVTEGRLDGLDQIELRDYATHTPKRLPFPEASYSASLDDNPEYDVTVLRIGYESMVTPDTIFDYHIAQERFELLKVQEIPSGYDASRYATERLMIPARDGTQIPVSIVYPAGLPRDGSAPLHLYGYGAYGMAMEPGFSTGRLSLLDRGFAFAIAHIRGGDDLGQQWYLDGKLDKRNNTFTDFVDVARGLIDLGYSSKGRISISGGSAGGELMGAVINSDPDLWGAVVAHVPFVDVLNTMLDETLPLTPGEWPEWGNPIEDKAAFETILAYDPYANVKAQDYPPLMVTAGLNDPRVTYWEPAKWVAKLRATKTDDNVLLLKTNMGAGHGGKSGRFESLHESAEEFAFILWQMGMAGA
ncbi:MAG: S9 family peptidase [Pseudomonadota bacterium]|uniref:Oligopeptidase B n=1 Tax=Sphingobium xenophagum TaxID=121428 RepID=A0A249MR54_SPHXE|nr:MULTISPECIES: S9 family peptidase [Sphingobium]ASY43639.1 S9 family peptidase [Sphingobium xenophagum]MBG6117876.1 oligopeptidase B [Sphingobium sp. JAI105]OUC55613.1 S9 family peptidase [Sphingobium sp. GW456-12-10-14-TSB1]PSO12297.1 S9 family peptidase [Sphingobium sp. AEW4]QWT13233.1 S9 family peptidase [Sphingobium xenophagum]|tara:strand:- start:811 stop:2898 length:2088 start_codon:yes stop_codon:yes gene_type:complete